jgi:carbon storage regulator
MLVLSRKMGESISIGKDISIKIVSIDKNNVKIGVDAPKSIVILREELKDAVKSMNVESTQTDTATKASIAGLTKRLK